MLAIRLSKKDRGKAWRLMIGIGPITLIAKDPVYVVSPMHLQMLDGVGIPYEIVKLPLKAKGRKRASPG